MNIYQENRKKYPLVWKCYKLPLIALDRVICGEIEYNPTIERLLNVGFRLLKASKEAVPAADGWICDCGDWVDNSDDFHEVLDWSEW